MKVVFVFLVSILNSHLLDCLVAIMNKSLVRCAVPHNRHIILHYGMLSLANRVDGTPTREYIPVSKHGINDEFHRLAFGNHYMCWISRRDY